MKRDSISTHILAAGLLCTLLAACGDAPSAETTGTGTSAGDPAAVTETAAETEEPTALSTLPAADYQGHIFRVLHENQENQQVDIETVGEENGDVLNDLVFRRNSLVEEMYNIKIDASNADGSTVNSTIQKQVSAGLTEYDLYFHNCTVISTATGGYLYNLYEMPNMNMENPWWDKAALDGLSVAGMAYMATGDISPTSLMISSCLTFNKTLFSEYDMELPYDMVRNGTWTLDALAQMTKGLSRDLNGDGKMTYGDDLFSYSGWSYDNPYALFYGAGGMLSEKDADDIPHISYDFDRINAIYDYMYQIVVENEAYYVTDGAIYPQTYSCFTNGGAFFCDAMFFKIDRYFRDMEDEFGIIPNPKFDENQENYITCVNGAGNFIVIPNNPADAARTGMITEALAAAAYDSITPSLYDIIIKGRNTRDEDSAEMVDIIISNRVFDPHFINNISGYNFAQTLLAKASREVVSSLTKTQKNAEKNLQKIVDAYLETAEN